MISGPQIAAARVFLGYRQKEFAELAGVSNATICTYERGYLVPPHRMKQLIAMFTAEGIEFINADGNQGFFAPVGNAYKFKK